MSIVRRMREDDVEAAATVGVAAFGGDVAARVQRLREGPRFTWRDGWVVETDGGEIGATATAFPVTFWLGGTSYTASAIGGVAVRATERRRGLASAMMRALLEADLQAGRSFSMLYPFQHGFYRRLGYATTGFTHYYRIPIAHLPDVPALRRNVRFVREEDRDIISELYRRALPELGGLERSDAQWEQRWRTTTQTWVVYDDGAINGYLTYDRDNKELRITDVVARTPAAERGLWSFVAAQIEQCQWATYHAPTNKPLWATLREPLMFDAANRGFILEDAAALTASLQIRIVDPQAAFARRSFDAALSGSVTLALHDPVLAPNNGTWMITFAGGRAQAQRTDAEGQVHCDVVTLAQLFCGVLRATDARWYDLLQTDDDAAVALLDQAFANGATPFIQPADYF